MTEQLSAPAIIALGSNIDPERYLPAAVRSLARHSKITALKVSSVYESTPVGFLDQPAFCNAAMLIETVLDPHSLKFDVLRSLEDQLGRVRDPKNKNGPRTIDLDIGLFGAIILESDDLVIPDPEISQRAFLSVPFAEIAPEFLNPVSGVTLAEIAEQALGFEALNLRSDISLRQSLESNSKSPSTLQD